jgi:hypothetical protein
MAQTLARVFCSGLATFRILSEDAGKVRVSHIKEIEAYWHLPLRSQDAPPETAALHTQV